MKQTIQVGLESLEVKRIESILKNLESLDMAHTRGALCRTLIMMGAARMEDQLAKLRKVEK